MNALLLLVLLVMSIAWSQDDSVAANVRRGNELMRVGKFSEAAAIYAALVRTHPNDPGLRMNLGMAQHMAGNYRAAVEELERVVKIQPRNAPALIMLGSSYLRLGEARRAVLPLKQAASVAPEMREVDELVGEALFSSGDYEGAVNAYQRWSLSEPRNPRAWYGLGRALEALAQFEFADLKQSHPESGYTIALAAAEQFDAAHYSRAYYLYREALAREPQIGGLHAAVAEVYLKTGHPDWASQERAKEESGADCGRHPKQCAFFAGRFEEAAARADLPSAETRYWRVRALRELARRAFERVESLGDSVEARAVRAILARKRGRYGESIEHWRAALAAAGPSPSLEKELAITLRLNDDYAGARSIVERLVRRTPHSAELNYLLGQVLVSQQQPQAAVPFLEKAVQLEPSFLAARSSLGLALAQLGRELDAVPHLKAALPLDTDGSLHFRLARAYQKMGDAAGARAVFARYKELQSQAESQAKALEQDMQITPP